MVDLGFLLITFFIFTTSMSEPKSLKLNLPETRNIRDSSQTAEGATLQLVLGKNDELWYYHGSGFKNIKMTDYGWPVRHLIIEKKKDVIEQFGSEKEFVLIIKPTKYSSMKNIVSVLDEILINQVKRYVFMEPNELEQSKVE